MQETWLPVVGYEGLYEVSDCGNVRSVDRFIYDHRKTPKLLKGKPKSLEVTRDGYLRVSLHANGISRKFPVHRIVAFAFIENAHNKPFINHIDGKKANNDVSNLEWCTQSENVKHSYLVGLQKANIGERAGGAQLTESDVIEIRRMASIGISQKKIAELFNQSQSNISSIVLLKRWKHV